MSLRSATIEDIPKLVKTSKIWIEKMGYKFNADDVAEDMERVIKTGVIYIVELEDRIIGFMSGMFYPVFWTGERIAEEHWFFVNPDYQRKGIGKLLEKAFRGWATVMKCNSVIITPNRHGSTDPKGVSEYLEKQGYHIHGYRMKRSLDDVLR